MTLALNECLYVDTIDWPSLHPISQSLGHPQRSLMRSFRSPRCISPCAQLVSLEPATHAYAAWEGFPLEAMMAIGRLFAATRSLRAITIVQRSMRNKV